MSEPVVPASTPPLAAGPPAGGPISTGASQRVPLVLLTALKFLANALLRLPYPFIGDVGRGLGIENKDVGRLLSVGELGGLAGVVIGRQLDQGKHRRWLAIGYALAGLGGGIIAASRSSIGLMVGFACTGLGVNVLTNAGHAYLGSVVPFSRRARAIGLFETSWALALLIGGFVAGLLIDTFSWWVPFGVFGLVLLCLTPLVLRAMPSTTAAGVPEAVQRDGVQGTSMNVVLVCLIIGSSVVLTFGQVLLFASMGPFLENRHSFSTAAIGFVAVGLGAMELGGSGGTATLADRLGTSRAVLGGELLMVIGVGALVLFGLPSAAVAVVSIMLYFLGFEFAYVSLLAIISEVGGPRRGLVVALDHAAVTITRAAAALIGPWAVGETAQHFRPVMVAVLLLAAASVALVLIAQRQQ
jgi:MFS transporter, DHA1 family, inner membrane transport protein